MTTGISSNKSGLALGAVLGLYHLAWVLLVASGWAQTLVDFILWLHFIKPFVAVEAFDAGRAAGLVALTAGIGYAIGWTFAFLWNCIQKS